MYRLAIRAGCLFAALAVIFGAFGAHALTKYLIPARLVVYETGIKYQFYHSFALIFCGIIYYFTPNKLIRIASAFFIAGIILFCGSLYGLELLSLKGVDLGVLGIVTPIGGLCFISGWLALFLGVNKKLLNEKF